MTENLHPLPSSVKLSEGRTQDMAGVNGQLEIEKGVGIPSEDCPTRISGKYSRPTQRLRQYLAADVDPNHADILLLSCCLISGLVDSTIYNAYGTFVSMQTGGFSASPPLCNCIDILSALLSNHHRQHHLLRSRWCHTAPHIQTIRLGEILHLDRLLLPGMLLLLTSISLPRPLPSRRPNCILPPPVHHDLHCRSNRTSRCSQRGSRHHHGGHRLAIRSPDRAAEFPIRGPDRWQPCLESGGDPNRGSYIDASRRVHGPEAVGFAKNECEEE